MYTLPLVKIKLSKEVLRQHYKLPLFKNAYHLIFGAGLSSVLGFFFWIIAARVYAIDTIGFTSVLISTLSLFAIFAELGLGIGLIRFLPEVREDANSLINTCFTISSGFSVILSIIFIIGLPFWGQTLIPFLYQPFFSLTFIIFSIFFSIFPILSIVFLAKRTTKYIVYINILSGICKIGLLFVILLISQSVYGLFFIAGFSVFIGLIIGIYIFLPRIQPSFRLYPTIHFKLLKDIRNYSAVNYISRLLLQMTPLIYPLMIVNILGSEMNAYFFISWTFISLAQIIPSSLFNSLLAEGAHENTLNIINIKQAFFLMLALLLPVTILIIALPNFFLSFFGQIYSDQGSTLLQILILSVIPWGVIYLYLSVERLKKFSKSIIYVTLLSACLSIGLGYLLMIEWGLLGLGIGYLTGQIIVALIAAILLWRMMMIIQYKEAQ